MAIDKQDLIVTDLVDDILMKLLAQKDGVFERAYDTIARLGVIGAPAC